MATTSTKPSFEAELPPLRGVSAPSWPRDAAFVSPPAGAAAGPAADASHHDALQALLAFSALHTQVRRRRALASASNGFETLSPAAEFEQGEQFVLDEVLQLVAERAVAITGADGLAIALAENNEIVLRASAGLVRPDVGARIDRDSAFSGACFRRAQIVRCDDTETDDRVNLQACRKLGARSMVAVPLCGRRRVIGLLEAFSEAPFGFNDSDVRNLELLAELVLGALKPEDEDRFAESAQAAATQLAFVTDVNPEPLSKDYQAPFAPAPPPANFKPASVVIQSKAAQSASPAPILPEPAAAPEKIIDSRISATTEAKTDESSASPHRPGVLVVLICIVIATVLAGGIWWKVKNAQLGSEMIQAQRQDLKPADSSQQTPKEPISPPAIANPRGIVNPDTDLGPSSIANQPAATAEQVSKFPRVSGIRHWSSADSSTVVLDLQDQVQYEAHRLSRPDRIYFDLHDTALVPELSGKSIEVGDTLLNRIRVAQPLPGITRIVLETRGNSNFSVSLEPNPYRLVVELRKIGATPKASLDLFANPSNAKALASIVIPPPTKEDQQLRARVPKMRIVVDAGHGGWDLGTVGRGGLLEKDLVLEIAERLGKLLENRLNADVIYTREDDSYIPLDERAGMANQAQADLFVSVHANYSDLPSARGVETYYANFFSSPSAKDLETRASAGGNVATNAVLTTAELHDRVEQSRRLAASVQRSLYGTLSVSNPGLRDRGVKEAGFVVLTETSMPGILAEVSFVSSPTDEQRLRSDGYRERIAEALYKGIARYAATSRGVKLASAAK
jgi:N-acetylmuramoyl-L-alanine amidase/putative methionine-R-sulfoxide reductase with GAF domain